jgi:hypothetical protein
VVVVVVLVVLGPGVGRAQLGTAVNVARHRLRYRSLTAAQGNPLGLQSDLMLGYRYRLWDRPGVLYRDSFAGAMAIARLNPAYARLGAGAELRPLAVLTLRALYEHRLYFSTFNMMQSFASPRDAYSDDDLSRRGEAGENYAGHGHEITLQAELRAKVGPVALLDDFNAVYFGMDLRGGDRLFYVNLFDTLCPNNRFTLINHGHLLYITSFGLIAGVRHSVVHALYPEAWGNPNTPHHRLGPMLLYVFGDRGPSFRQPTLIVIVNWWIGNRYRSGSALPYGVLAFQFAGDLWTS